MKVLDGLNLTTMDSSFMRATGTEIVAGLNTITAGTRTTNATRTTTTMTTIARFTRP